MSQHIGIILPEAGLGTTIDTDSACVVELALKVQPGPHQSYTGNGT